MDSHAKKLIALLMAVLALGLWTPQPTCAATAPAAPAPCSCCADHAMSHCQSGMPCRPSCQVAPVQLFDKQLPARTVVGASHPGGLLLFLIAPTKINHPAFLSVVHQGDENTSPPFGGSPPQAVLRLWLL